MSQFLIKESATMSQHMINIVRRIIKKKGLALCFLVFALCNNVFSQTTISIQPNFNIMGWDFEWKPTVYEAKDIHYEMNENEIISVDPTSNDYCSFGKFFPVIYEPVNGKVGVETYSPYKMVYQPRKNWSGTETIYYIGRSIDGAADAGKITITVKPVDDPVVVKDDYARTDGKTSVAIRVLVNDEDLDDKKSFEITSADNGQKGSVQISEDKQYVVYTPFESWTESDSDSFTYSIKNLNNENETGTGTVTVNWNDYLDTTMECDWDTSQNPEDEIVTDELVALVKKIGNNPVDIFNWVYNNIEFEDYDRSRKGAKATLFTRRGNEWDQASLLIALMRIAKIPARYVQYGAENDVFAEVLVPSNSYRGIGVGSKEEWLPLVPWCKDYYDGTIPELFTEYYNGEYIIPEGLDFDFLAYVKGAVQIDGSTVVQRSKTALEGYEEQIVTYLKDNLPGTSLSATILKKKVFEKNIGILPASLPQQLAELSGQRRVFSGIDDMNDEDRLYVDLALDIRYYPYAQNHLFQTRCLEKRFYMPELAAKSFCLDWQFTNNKIFTDGNEYEEVTPVLLVDGQNVSSAVVEENLSLPSFVLDEGIKKRFIYELFYRLPGEEKLTRHFIGYCGDYVQIGFDALSASDKVVEKMKKEVAHIDLKEVAENSKPYNRVAFLGHSQNIVMNTFLQREYEAIKRATDLVGCERNYECSLQPTLIPSMGELESTPYYESIEYLFAPRMMVKADTYFGSVQKKGTDQPSISCEKLNRLASELYLFSSAYNKEHLLSDWFNYESVGNLSLLMKAHDDGIDVVAIEKSDVTADADGNYNTLEVLQQYSGTDGGIDPMEIHKIIEMLMDEENYPGVKITVPVKMVEYNGGEYLPFLVSTDNQASSYTNFVTSPENQNSTQNVLNVDPVDLDASASVKSSLADDQGSIPVENSNTVAAAVSKEGDPVDMVNGEYYTDNDPDIKIKSHGFDLSVIRKYRSRLVYDGPFGYGWTWNHAEQIVPKTDGNLIYYNSDRSTLTCEWQEGTGSYKVPDGFMFRVEKLVDNTYKVTNRDGGIYRFSENGFLSYKEDTFGNRLTFNWEGETLKYITGSFKNGTLNRKLMFEYTNNKVSKVYYNDDPTIFCEYSYNNYGIAGYKYDLVSFTDLEGNVTRYEYLKEQENEACNHNMCKYILPDDDVDPNNNDFLELGYYKNDTVAFHTNKIGDTFNFQYSFVSRYAETWNEAGYYRKLFYNENYDVIRITDRDGNIETKEYDSNHNVKWHIDGNGHKHTFTYDDNRNLLTVKNETLEATTTYEYNDSYTGGSKINSPTKVTDPSGKVTEYKYYTDNGQLHYKHVVLSAEKKYTSEYKYDTYGNLTSVIYPDSTSVVNTYSDNITDKGLFLGKVTDRLGNVTTMKYYPEAGWLKSVVNAEGHKTSFEYNKYGQKTKTTNPLGEYICYQYRAADRKLWKTIYPDNSVEERIYNPVRDIDVGADVVQIIDRMGNSEYFEYDAVGNVIAKTDKNGNGWKYQYDGKNRLIVETDPFQKSIYYAYDGVGNLTEKIDKNGSKTTYSYDAANRKTKEKYANGAEVEFKYYKNGQLKQEIDALDVITEYTYDGASRLVTKTVGKGLQEDGKSLERFWRFFYEDDGNYDKITMTISPIGHYVTFAYDANGNKINESKFDKNQPQAIDETGYQYNSLNQLVKQTSFDGGVTEFAYDEAGRKNMVMDPLGNQTISLFDAMGNVTDLVNAKGHRSRYRYDKLGRKISEINGRGYETKYHYDNNGNLIRVVDALGNEFNTYYDALNRKCMHEDSQGNKTTYTYDANGNLTTQVNALGQVSTMTYNSMNQLHTRTNYLGSSVENEYTLRGNISKVWDDNDAYVHTIYNHFGEAKEVRQLVNHITQENDVWQNEDIKIASTVYNNLGLPVMQTDAKDVKTVTEYDAIGRVVAVTRNAKGINIDGTAIVDSNPDNPSIVTRTEYALYDDENGKGNKAAITEAFNTEDAATTERYYDLNSNVVKITNAKGGHVRYKYDSLNQVEEYYDEENAKESYSYDEVGNRTELIRKDETTVVTYTYDELNRQEEIKVDNVTRRTFGYDELSRMTSAVEYDKNGTEEHTVEYEYDALSRVVAEVQDGQRIAKVYEAEESSLKEFPELKQAGLTSTLLNGNIVHQYNERGQLIKVQRLLLDETEQLILEPVVKDIKYYNNGLLNSMSFNNGVEQNLCYDQRNREEERSYKTSSGIELFCQNVHGYDSFDNVKLEQVTVTAPHFGNGYYHRYSYDNLQRLEKVEDVIDENVFDQKEAWDLDKLGNWDLYTYKNDNGDTVEESRSVNEVNEYNDCIYDVHGNLTQEPGDSYVYEYDWANRLKLIRNGADVVAEYSYDALNRRVSKTLASTGTQIDYQYFGSQVVAEKEGSVVKRSFIYGAATDDPIAMVDGFDDSLYYYLKDRLYSVVGLVDESGAVVESYNYSAYGVRNVYNAQGGIETNSLYSNPYGYTGRRFDEESGLWYYRNRMYSAELGRFLQRDPAGYVDGMNLYAYVENNPLMHRDPFGLWSWDFDFDFDFDWDFDFDGLAKSFFGGLGKGIEVIGAGLLALDYGFNFVGKLVLGNLGLWTGNALQGIGNGAGFLRQSKIIDSIPIVNQVIRGLDDMVNEPIDRVSLVTVKNGREMPIKDLWVPKDGESALATALKGLDWVRHIWLNGQSNDLDNSKKLARESHVLNGKDGSYILIHNRTSGAIADTIQSIFGKFTNGTKVSEQVSILLQDRANRDVQTYFTVHSQGAVMGTNALFRLNANGVNWSKLTMRYHGSASNKWVAQAAVNSVGANWGGMNNHYADAVGELIGLNGNPLTMAYSLLVSPTLVISADTWLIGSSHTHYSGTYTGTNP